MPKAAKTLDIAIDDTKEPSIHSSAPSASKPLLSAHSAYQSGDIEASKRYHSTKQSDQSLNNSADTAEEGEGGETERKRDSEAHSTYGEHIKSIVYGGLDGIITTFATVTSVAGAQLSPVVIVVLGISHLVADGLSMGTGDAMSSQAEIDMNKNERRRERWEMENNMQGEIDEMITLYTNKGVSRKDAEVIITTMSRYPRQFLDHMMVEELGLPPPDTDISPVKAGFITMCSFMLFGSIPLLPYLIALIPWTDSVLTDSVQLWLSVVTTVLTLFSLGVVKAKVSGSGSGLKSLVWSGVQMAMNGSFAAVLGFIVGWGMGKLVHADEQLPPGTD